MASFSLSIIGEMPTAWGSNTPQLFTGRDGKPKLAPGKNTKATKRWLLSHLTKQGKRVPLSGPLVLKVVAVWPYRNEDNRAAAAKELVPKTTKPDGDNVLKTLKDAMEEAGVYVNDAQVFSEHIDRYFGPTPGIKAVVSEAPDAAPGFTGSLFGEEP